MAGQFTTLTEEQVSILEDKLEAFDRPHTPARKVGRVSVGLLQNGKLMAAADGVMSVYGILYVSTAWVDERLHRQGSGRVLMAEMEHKARALGARLLLKRL